jgi:hypothetical protein
MESYDEAASYGAPYTEASEHITHTAPRRKQKADMETTEGAILKVMGICVWWGLGLTMNGCADVVQRATSHDSELAVIARLLGIASSGSVFIYTTFKMWRLWRNSRTTNNEE